MKRNNGGKSSFFLALLQILGGFMLLVIGSGEKDSWEYYLSSSRRSDIDTGVMIGWLIIIAGVVELVYGFIMMSVADNAQSGTSASEQIQENVIDWVEGEIVKREWNPEEPQREWLLVQRTNGSITKAWRNTSDRVVCKVGDRGVFRIEQHRITKYIPAENDQLKAD